MTKHSAGLLLYRWLDGELELLLGHMGGPFWARKTDHSWSIPKGLAEGDEVDLLLVAEREFAEEMGTPAPPGETIKLREVKSSGKIITVFARQGDFDADAAVSNTFTMEWPRGSGTMQEFPEIDRAEWVRVSEATRYLTKGQAPFVAGLLELVAGERTTR